MARAIDRPNLTDPARSPEQAREIAEALRGRVDNVTAAWHEALCGHMNIRPETVFPTDELLDHVHLVVEHIIDLIETDEEIPSDALDALGGVAEHWHHAGYAVEEALLHFRILNRIMHEELREVVGNTSTPLTPESVARIAESLSHGSGLVQAVIVGTYRDRGEERIANYASMVSHEIRGPLSAALAALQTIEALDGSGAEAEGSRRQALERAQATLWQANRIVGAVKSLVALGDGEGPGERRPLPDIVSTLLAELDGESEGVTVEWEGEVPEIDVPYESVIIALHNLIKNAVAYSDPAKAERWVRIRCHYAEAERAWAIEVSDNGVGIPEDEQRLIFKRFRRGTSARGEGFGLGLSIVREAAWRINGDVSLESEPGEGSTFTFSFPAQSSPAPSRPDHEPDVGTRDG